MSWQGTRTHVLKHKINKLKQNKQKNYMSYSKGKKQSIIRKRKNKIS